MPGTDAERGLTQWAHRPQRPAGAGGSKKDGGGGGGGSGGDAACVEQEGAADADWDWWEDDHMNAVYGLPFGLTRRYMRAVGVPLRARRRRLLAPLSARLAPAARALRAALTCGGRCGPQRGVAAAGVALPTTAVAAAAADGGAVAADEWGCGAAGDGDGDGDVRRHLAVASVDGLFGGIGGSGGGDVGGSGVRKDPRGDV